MTAEGNHFLLTFSLMIGYNGMNDSNMVLQIVD